MNDDQIPARTSRRALLAAGVAAAAWSAVAQTEPTPAAIAAALPLDTLGLEHIGTVVPDVTRAALFYSRVFNPVLYKERDQPLRYDVAAVVRGLEALGARIVTSAPECLHFRCPDGLGVELVPVDPARIWGLA